MLKYFLDFSEKRMVSIFTALYLPIEFSYQLKKLQLYNLIFPSIQTCIKTSWLSVLLDDTFEISFAKSLEEWIGGVMEWWVFASYNRESERDGRKTEK